MDTASPNIILAFVAGLVSFLSPCVLPLVPAYIGYMGGSTVIAARSAAAAGANGGTRVVPTAAARWAAVSNALIFVLGFTIVFVLVIGGLAGALSSLLRENRRLIQEIMGVLLVVFGLHMVGLINIPFLNYERRLNDTMRPSSSLGYLRSFLIGVGFAIGWTPCIGPVLSSIFTLSLSGDPLGAFPLFLSYSLGLGVPFIVTAMALGQVSGWLKKLTRRSWSLTIGSWKAINDVNVISIVSGVLLLGMGVLIFTNWVTILAPSVSWFNL